MSNVHLFHTEAKRCFHWCEHLPEWRKRLYSHLHAPQSLCRLCWTSSASSSTKIPGTRQRHGANGSELFLSSRPFGLWIWTSSLPLRGKHEGTGNYGLSPCSLTGGAFAAGLGAGPDELRGRVDWPIADGSRSGHIKHTYDQEGAAVAEH